MATMRFKLFFITFFIFCFPLHARQDVPAKYVSVENNFVKNLSKSGELSVQECFEMIDEIDIGSGNQNLSSSDDLTEGVVNLYWQEAPNDGKQYARQSESWTEINSNNDSQWQSDATTVSLSLTNSGKTVVMNGQATVAKDLTTSQTLYSNNVQVGSGAKSVGVNSSTIGGSSLAIGQDSVAIGYDSEARGDYSIAVGTSAVADSNASAVGYSSRATAMSSAAVGSRCSATGLWSSAIGSGAKAKGNFSTAAGWGISTGDTSIAIGVESDSVGLSSVAIGSGNRPAASKSMAFGNDVCVDQSAEKTIIFGNGYDSSEDVTATGSNQVIFYSAENPIKVGINTLSASETLDVNGNIICNDLSADGDITTSGYLFFRSDKTDKQDYRLDIKEVVTDQDFGYTNNILFLGSTFESSIVAIDGEDPIFALLAKGESPFASDMSLLVFSGNEEAIYNAVLSTGIYEGTDYYIGLIDTCLSVYTSEGLNAYISLKPIDNDSTINFKFSNLGAGLSANSVNQAFLSLDNEVTQTGSAGYTTLEVNTRESRTGSGEHNAIQVNQKDSNNSIIATTFQSDFDGNTFTKGSFSIGEDNKDNTFSIYDSNGSRLKVNETDCGLFGYIPTISFDAPTFALDKFAGALKGKIAILCGPNGTESTSIALTDYDFGSSPINGGIGYLGSINLIHGTGILSVVGSELISLEDQDATSNCSVGDSKVEISPFLKVSGDMSSSGSVTISGGVFFDNNFNIKTNSTNLILTGNNVGIGTSIPSAKLNVRADIQTSPAINAYGYCIMDGQLSVDDSLTASADLWVNGHIYGGGITTYNYITESTSPARETISAQLSVQNTLWVDGSNLSARKVGIANPSPTYTLDVNGTISNSYIRMDGNQIKNNTTSTSYLNLDSSLFGIYTEGVPMITGGWDGALSPYGYYVAFGNYGSDVDFRFNTNSEYGTMFIESGTGNVGIGGFTKGSPPADQLDVKGGVTISSNLTMGGDLTVNGTISAPFQIPFTIDNPNALSETSALFMMKNTTSRTLTITKIESMSDANNTDFTIKRDASPKDKTFTTIQAITISTAITGGYANTTTSFTNSTLAPGQSLYFDNDATDTPNSIGIVIYFT